jgi:hypothetical protein
MYTPYKIHTLVNALRTEAGVATIAPQQMYNYSRNGLLGHPKVAQSDGRKINLDHQYTEDEVKAYLTKVAKKLGLEPKESTEVEGQMSIEQDA